MFTRLLSQLHTSDTCTAYRGIAMPSGAKPLPWCSRILDSDGVLLVEEPKVGVLLGIIRWGNV